MEVNVKALENQQVELEITAPAAELDKAYDAACKSIAGRINIPGFRKGKAPKLVVERHVGKENILSDAFERLGQKTLTEALEKEDIEIVTRPEIDVVTLELGKDGIHEGGLSSFFPGWLHLPPLYVPHCAVGEHYPQSCYMVARRAIDEAVCAAGVVSHHSADTTAVGGGGLRREEEPVRTKRHIQFIPHHARLYTRKALFGVNRENTVHIPAHIHHNTFAHHLTGYTCTSGTGDKMGIALACLSKQKTQVVLMLGVGYTCRYLTVGGSIRGICQPVHRIGMYSRRHWYPGFRRCACGGRE